MKSQATPPKTELSAQKRRALQGLALLCVLFLAMNLRAPFTGMAPLSQFLIDAFDLHASQLGLLTSLPLVMFALVSPWVPALMRRMGLEQTVILGLLLILAGIGLRVIGAWSWILIGTLFIGAGIAIGNVLLPSVIKRDFARHAAVMTSIYSIMMGLVSALASAYIVPLTQHFDGNFLTASLSFMILPILGLVVWMATLGIDKQPSPYAKTAKQVQKAKGLTSQWLAWQVSLYLGLNSLNYYIMVAWLPQVVVSQGLTVEAAGQVHGVMQMATALPGVLLLPILMRVNDHRLMAASAALGCAGAVLGLILLPQWAWLWACVYGFSSGAGFILGLSFLSLRASNQQQAAGLSGMAQSIGYCLAAAGPIVFGSVAQAHGDWELSLSLCVIVGVIGSVFGWFAGKPNRVVE